MIEVNITVNLALTGTNIDLTNSVVRIIKAEQKKVIMSDDLLYLSYESPIAVGHSIGDTVTVFGEKYTLNLPPNESRNGAGYFVYDLVFESRAYDLLKILFLDVDKSGNNWIGRTADFSLTGPIERFLTIIPDNITRAQGNNPNWKSINISYNVSDLPTDVKTLTFNSLNCLQALQQICKEFDVQYHTEVGSNDSLTFYINKKTEVSVFPDTLEYGYGGGLYDIKREVVNTAGIVTKLFAYGGTRNIPSNYRNGSPKLKLPIATNIDSYVENTQASNRYGVVEQIHNFDDVFPVYKFVVSGADGYLTFGGCTFDLNAVDAQGQTVYLIPGNKAKVSFITGELAGYEFTVDSFKSSNKAITIAEFTDSNGMKFPQNIAQTPSGVFCIKNGDEFILTDVIPDNTKILEAEAKLLAKANEYLSLNSTPEVTYSISLDEYFFLSKYASEINGGVIVSPFVVGQYLRINDTDMSISNLQLRINGLTRDVLNPFRYQIEISNTVRYSLAERIVADNKATKEIIIRNNLQDPIRAKRNWQTTSELATKLDTLRAEMLLIGDDAGSYSTDIVTIVNFNNDPNGFKVFTGTINHQAYENNTNNIWLVSSIYTATLGSGAYYVYFKCSTTTQVAVVVISQTKIKVDEVADYFHFPFGIISSAFSGQRLWNSTRGYSQIVGGSIKTGRIQSADGTTYFDLDSGEFKGAFKFTNGTSVDNAISTAQSNAISTAAADATSKANAAYSNSQSYANAIKTDLQSQIDGNITSWFFDYGPLLTNVPASSWGTDAVKDIHLGDLFYWTSKGWAYRFQKVGSVYSWTRIADTDVTKALADAATAQTIANGKMQTFSVQPTPPYAVGDLWLGGASGDLKKCKTAKANGGAFSSADWELASKYTDDTAVNNLQIGGRNLLKKSATSPAVVVGGLSGWGGIIASRYSAFSFGGLSLKSNQRYVVSFLAWTNSGSYALNTDLYPDTLPQVWNIITTTPTKFSNTLQSASSDMQSCSLRFFVDGADVSSNIYITDIQLEIGNKATDWTPAPEDVAADVAAAQTAANNAQTTANSANSSVSSLNGYVDGAFKDGVISQSEAQAIEKYKNQVTKDFNDLIAGYNVVYANAYLSGAPKTDLLNAKVAMSGAKDNLLTSINNAIADGKTTTAEKADVDTKYATWDTSYAAYKSKLELANKSIQSTIEALAASDATNKVNAVQVGGRNLVLNSTYNSEALRSPSSSFVKKGMSISPTIKKKAVSVVTQMAITVWFDEYSSGFGTTKPFTSIVVGKASGSGDPWSERLVASSGTIIKEGAYWVWRGVKTFPAGSTIADTETLFFIFEDATQMTGMKLVNVKAELGNKATDWTPAPEDVQAEIAAAQADATIAKQKTAGRTLISGGVVETQLILLGNGGIAGISGIHQDANGNSMPSRWAGGTYTDAIAKAATIIEWFDGDAKYGDLWIDGSGSISIKDYMSVVRLLLSKNNIASLASISAAMVNLTVNNNDLIYIDTVSTNRTFDFANTIVVENNGSKLDISASLYTKVTTNAANDDISNSYVSLALYASGGAKIADIGNITGHRTDTITTKAIAKSINVAAGTYVLKAYVVSSFYPPGGLIRSEVTTPKVIVTFDASVRRTEIGANGMAVIGGLNNYSYRGVEGSVYKVVERTTGMYDVPSGLGGATVTSGGSVSRNWGVIAATSQVTKSGANITINHSIGDLLYTAMLVGVGANVTGYISSRTNTQIVMVVNGTFTAGTVDIILKRTI